jgi:hypothetical protein
VNPVLRTILAGLLGGMISGTLVLGIGGRILMRGIAIMAGGSGNFSWGGSLEVVFLGSLIGLISGAFMGLSLQFAMRNKLIWGLLQGFLAYLMVLVLPIGGKAAAKGFPDLQVTIHLIFGGLFLLYGILAALIMLRFSDKE